MAVNDELAVLRRAIPESLAVIGVGGRVVVESYHSLEDRLVKRAFADATRLDVPPDLPFIPEGAEPALRLVTRGAEQADEHEIAENPRAASVRLRAVERVRPSAPSASPLPQGVVR
jgi:16S rRNA (cytosine1402-N4)-methyltransferase